MHNLLIADIARCIALNATSLVLGVIGNVFLLFNFTQRIRYIIALPMTIILWYFATGIVGTFIPLWKLVCGLTYPQLITITLCMNRFVPPVQPVQTYSQGFWHAVIAASLYLIASMLLMVNMLGYVLGHYPQHFELTDEQRHLILQTMMFFVWLAGGGAVFARVCGFSFVDALYFCDVTVLTVGFGDIVADNNVGRGLVFPFSVGGIIILGLMVTSIRRFAQELGHSKVIKHHVESIRSRTFERAVTNSYEAAEKYRLEDELEKHRKTGIKKQSISAPFNPQKRTITFDTDMEKANRDDVSDHHPAAWSGVKSPLSPLKSPLSAFSNMSSNLIHGRPLSITKLKRSTSRRSKLLILREEKDRFDAMRNIQHSTKRFKQYFALSMSVIACKAQISLHAGLNLSYSSRSALVCRRCRVLDGRTK